MPSNLHCFHLRRALAAFAVCAWPRALAAQQPCPAESVAAIETAWAAYRRDSLDLAEGQFLRGVAGCARRVDAVVGLGFVALRRGALDRADSLFSVALERDPEQVDAWEGRARTAWRRGDTAATTRAAREALALAPDRTDLRELLDRSSPDWERPPLAPRRRPDTLGVPARTAGERFEVLGAEGSWHPFYIKGVNFGGALPGKFPSEFPTDSSLYAGWLDTLGAMHANTIRTYTILPPQFYRALRAWNLAHPVNPLWLVHGVWTELPPEHDFDDAGWKGEFRDEMRRVVDLVHGSAEIPPRPGHAAGRYDADVSRWTLAYIIGREWEPFAVKEFDQRHPGARSYRGRYLDVANGPAMDVWMAEQCDYLLAYEADTWNSLRPIAYTNWPTLDPLTHATEANTDQERQWRRQAGREAPGRRLEYENDAIALDANLVRPTAQNPAGWFASYHAYPYYPDFLLFDPDYSQASSSEGRSNYFGYLTALHRYHRGLPFIVSEYGVPSSRGLAHLQPQGWHHGGLDERQMAKVDARLTREIKESGAAGSIIFAWMDEWFKKNWIVIDLEIPGEHTRRWRNVMDAEQHYGILGQYAGEESERPVLGGEPGPWRRLDSLAGGGPELHVLRAGSDASYLYLSLQLPTGPLDWHTVGVQLALDTYRADLGQRALPDALVRGDIGWEFLIDLRSPDSATIRVTPSYNPYVGRGGIVRGDDFGRFYRRPATPGSASDGRFDSLFVITNRARFGRDGTFYPAQGYDRGVLRHATEDTTTLADWYHDASAGLIEIRVPWGLLNVTDPSTRTVLFDDPARAREDPDAGDFGTATTDGVRVGAVLYRKGDRPRAVATLPGRSGNAWSRAAFRTYTWTPWEEPRSHSRLKPVYDSLRTLWREP